MTARRNSAKRLAPIAILALLFTFGGATAQAARTNSEEASQNLLFITIDTWRWDYLGAATKDSIAQGTARVATPNLDALADSGLLFVDTQVAAPVTLVSHASLFTGTEPTTHGVHHNGSFVLGPDHTTLAESLRAAGYQTAAVTGAYVVNSRFGLAQGFDTYLDVYPRDLYESGGLTPFYPELTATEVTDRSLELLRAMAAGPQGKPAKPWMLWAHYFDPHASYRAPEAFAKAYPKDPYAAEIAYVDAEIGRLLEGLGSARSRTAVVVTADHGEGLGEHGEATHGHFVYDSTVRVSTVLQLPGAPRGQVLRQRVRSIDLMPTVLTSLGISVPASAQGRDLAPLWRGEASRSAAYAETFLPYYDYGWAYQRSMTLDGWKYILSPEPELYDLTTDPGERKNRIAAEPERAASLRATLERMVAATTGAQAPMVQVDAAERSALASLGYVGGSKAPPAETAEELATLPDPKARIHLEEELGKAWAAQSRGDLEGCLKILDRVLKDDVRNSAALRLAAAVSRELGRHERSLKYLATLGKHWPSEAWRHDYAKAHRAWKEGQNSSARKLYDQLLLPCETTDSNASAERCFDSLSDLVHLELEESAGAAQKALDRHPLAAVAGVSVADHLRLAHLRLKAGQPSEAEAAMKALSASYPRVPDVHLALGNLYRDSGRGDAAIAAYQRALAADGQFVHALNNLATLYGTRGDLKRSNAVLQRALDAEPDNSRAMGNLALNFYLEGRSAEAVRLLERAVELDPAAVNPRINLARIHLEAQRVTPALALAQEVQQLDPDNVMAQRILDRFSDRANHPETRRSRGARSREGN